MRFASSGSLAALAALSLVGCGSEDEWGVRPPGGGPGIHQPGVDAAPRDAADGPVGDGGGDGLEGVICVVSDLRVPLACPTSSAAADVLVRRVGDLTGVVSGADGRFTLGLSDPSLTLDVAAGSTTLQPSIITVPNAGAQARVPVPTVAAWDATVASLGVASAPGSGAIVAYIANVDATPAQSVLFDLPPGASTGPFYDGASATTWTTAGGTGARGAVLLVDLPPGTYTLEGNLVGRTVALTVPVYEDAVTFGFATLQP